MKKMMLYVWIPVLTVGFIGCLGDTSQDTVTPDDDTTCGNAIDCGPDSQGGDVTLPDSAWTDATPDIAVPTDVMPDIGDPADALSDVVDATPDSTAVDATTSDEASPGGDTADSEVEPVNSCPEVDAKVLDGDFEIQNQLDVEQIASYTHITGSLTLTGPGTIALPALREIGGGLHMGSGGVETVQLPCVESVGDSFTAIYPDNLASLDIHRLKKVGGKLEFWGVSKLETLALPELTTVGSHLFFSEMTALTQLEFGALTSILGDLYFEYLPNVTDIHLADIVEIEGGMLIFDVGAPTLALNALQSVGHGIAITSNSELESCTMPLLTSVAGKNPDLGKSQSNVTVTDNQALVSLDLGVLQAVPNELTIVNNTVLTSVDVSKVSMAGAVRVQNNEKLSVLDMKGLGSLVWDLKVKNNPALKGVELPVLVTSPTGVVVENNAALTVVDLGKLATSGSLSIADNPSLEAIDLGGLKTVAQGAQGGSLAIEQNAQLKMLTLENLVSVGASVTLKGALLLPSVNLSNLVSCQGFAVEETGIETLALPSLIDFGLELAWEEPPLFIQNNPNLTKLIFSTVWSETCWQDQGLMLGTVQGNPKLPNCMVKTAFGCWVEGGSCDAFWQGACPVDMPEDNDGCVCYPTADDIIALCPGDKKPYVVESTTVQDPLTGLMWQRCPNGADAAGPCSGAATSPEWWAANYKVCTDLMLAGHSDWRLPTKTELESLVDLAALPTKIDQNAFPNTPGDFFWTTSCEGVGSCDTVKYVVSFATGKTGSLYFSETAHIRCVR
jgi:hypothetical protein